MMKNNGEYMMVGKVDASSEEGCSYGTYRRRVGSHGLGKSMDGGDQELEIVTIINGTKIRKLCIGSSSPRARSLSALLTVFFTFAE